MALMNSGKGTAPPDLTEVVAVVAEGQEVAVVDEDLTVEMVQETVIEPNQEEAMDSQLRVLMTHLKAATRLSALKAKERATKA